MNTTQQRLTLTHMNTRIAMDDLLDFVKGRITELTKLREQYEAEGDYELDDYSAGAIDAYDIVRMKLEDVNA